MKLFSKRNNTDRGYSIRNSRRIISNHYDTKERVVRYHRQVITPEARTRLVALIQFITNSDVFLERYVLIENKAEKIHYLDKDLINNFSEAELGYKFSDTFDLQPFRFEGNYEWINNSDESEKFFNDYYLFDLLETIILFSKIDQRSNVIFRINSILKEERTGFSIIENLITRDGGEDLKNIVYQLKDDKLSEKIKAYYQFFNVEDYINACKISADILNIIFSDDSSGKKLVIAEMQESLANSVVLNSKEKDKRKKEFIGYFDSMMNISRTLNNQIYDIRHSEKTCIKISNEYFYKLICTYNMSLVEFTLTSLKDRYLFTEDWEAIKNLYIESYQINKNTRYYIPDPNDINPEDIPF
jgi:hypothetical protein